MSASETRNLRGARFEKAVGWGKIRVLGRYVGVLQSIFDVMTMIDVVGVSVLVKGW